MIEIKQEIGVTSFGYGIHKAIMEPNVCSWRKPLQEDKYNSIKS
jgi:hypothetical protein